MLIHVHIPLQVSSSLRSAAVFHALRCITPVAFILLTFFSLLSFSFPVSALEQLTVNGVNGELKKNIRQFLEPYELSRLQLYDGEDIVLERTQKALRALGYYGAEIEVTITEQNVTLNVIAGDPVIIESIKFDIKGDAEQDKAIQKLRPSAPKEGEVFHHGKYESFKSKVLAVALRKGYFDARFSKHRVRLDVEKRSANVLLVFDGGKRYRFGDIDIQVEGLQTQVIRSLLSFKPGDPYEATELQKLSESLLETRYFSQVEVSPQLNKKQNYRVPVLVELKLKPQNRVNLGLGYATDVGPRVQVRWQKPWINDRGHSILATTKISEVEKTADFTYKMPLENANEDFLELSQGWQSDNIEDIEKYVTSLQRTQQLSKNWIMRKFIRYEQESDNGDDSTTLLPGMSFTRTRKRGEIVPVWGDHLYFSSEFASKALTAESDMIKLQARAKWLRTYAEDHRVIARINVGTVASEGTVEDIPESLLFRAGGDQSIRGFGYKKVGVKNPDTGEIDGGRNIRVGSLEYEYAFVPNWRGAVFVDVGEVFTGSPKDTKTGVGFGVRWISPIGPIRGDFAWGVSSEPIKFRFHFSMGPAL